MSDTPEGPRLSKCTPEFIASFAETLIRNTGQRIKTCKEMGIAFQTFTVWMRTRGDFAEAVNKAQKTADTDLIETLLDGIRIHGAKDWKAWAWILERRFSELFALKTKTEVTNPGQEEREKKEMIEKFVKSIRNDAQKVVPKTHDEPVSKENPLAKVA